MNEHRTRWGAALPLLGVVLLFLAMILVAKLNDVLEPTITVTTSSPAERP